MVLNSENHSKWAICGYFDTKSAFATCFSEIRKRPASCYRVKGVRELESMLECPRPLTNASRRQHRQRLRGWRSWHGM